MKYYFFLIKKITGNIWKAPTKKYLAGEVGQNMKFLVSPESISLNLLWSIDQKHPNAFT